MMDDFIGKPDPSFNNQLAIINHRSADAAIDHYRRGVELAEAGQYEEGWNCLREHLRGAPQDVQALNDAGVVLHCLGRSQEAIRLLVQARDLEGDNAGIVCNLVEAHLGGGHPREAAGLLDDMERLGILTVDVLNRTAAMLLDQGDKSEAIEVLLRSQRLWPQQRMLPPVLEAIRRRRPKVVFLHRGAAANGVLGNIATFVRRHFHTQFYDGRNPGDVRELLDAGDIVWLDGGGPMLVAASRCGGGPKIIASVHRSDVRDDWVAQVCWENVAVLAQLGSGGVEELLLPQVPDLRRRTRLALIPNGVNPKRYPLRRRERGKHLVCVDGLTRDANPAFLLQCMQKLHYLDAGYRLFFAGTFESPMLEQYVRHLVHLLGLADVTSFEAPPDDWNAWFSDKHYVVSGGLTEDPAAGWLAAMSCGLKPVIHHFAGADTLLPAQHLFSIAEQFCEHVLNADYRPSQYHRFVEQRYPIERAWQPVSEILGQLETQIDAPTMAPLGPQTTAPTDSPVEPAAAESEGRA